VPPSISLRHAPPRRALAAFALALACAGPARAQALAGPRPSALWAQLPASDTSSTTGVRVEKSSEATRRLLIGGAVGGLLGALAGHTFCRRYGSSGNDGCGGDALWWGTGAALLGGLIGATSAEDAER
jgi:hypothetical protein